MAQASADMEQGFRNAAKDIVNKSGIAYDDKYGFLGGLLIDVDNIRDDIESLFDASTYVGDNNEFIRVGFQEDDPVTAYNRLHDLLAEMQKIRLANGEFTALRL